MRRRAWAIGAGGAVLLAAASASAEPTDADRALATQLFNEGRELVVARQYDAGCAKLLESHRLDPGGGTILNAAICHELAGKTATAWAEFTEALGWARRDHNGAREQTAQEHLNALEPRLSRITIIVPAESELPDLVVRRDGSPIASAAWGSAVPVDPGTHRVEASAAGRTTWFASFGVGPEADHKTATVPVLSPLAPGSETPVAAVMPAAPGAAVGAPDDGAKPGSSDTASSTKRTIALVTLGAGVVAAGVGTYFGLRALSKRGASDDACIPLCREESILLNEQAATAADLSTVFFGAAVVALGVGGYLFFTSARPSVGKRGASLVFERAF